MGTTFCCCFPKTMLKKSERINIVKVYLTAGVCLSSWWYGEKCFKQKQPVSTTTTKGKQFGHSDIFPKQVISTRRNFKLLKKLF